MDIAIAEPPLVLDLDGTLLHGDSAFEQLLHAASATPFRLARAVAAGGGRAAIKARLAQAAPLDPASCAWNEDVLALGRRAREDGRRVVLATAADRDNAARVAAHLGIFDEVIASDGAANLKGEAKARALVARFGVGGFDYAGDAFADLPVWAKARRAIVVAPTPRLLARVRARHGEVEVVGVAGPRLPPAAVWRSLRPHQWAKNALLLMPPLAAHRFDAASWAAALAAFVAFSLCASSVYLLNDLLDLRHDRAHPTKRHRPMASGALDARAGLAIACGLAALAFGGAALALPAQFLAVLAIYAVTTTAYSFALKRRAIWDVATLAGLYGLRLFAGAAATHVPISPWLLAFSLFLFFSLALIKRVTELTLGARAGQGGAPGRGYEAADLVLLQTLAAASGYASVVVLALYVSNPEVSLLYRRPSALWLACPVLLIWLSRALLLAHRGRMHDDPVVFALRDRTSLALGAAAFASFLLGSF